MTLDVKQEWVIDSVEAGNYNVMFPLVKRSIESNNTLTSVEKEGFDEKLSAIHVELINLTANRTFKDES